jgi:hypothetical protein
MTIPEIKTEIAFKKETKNNQSQKFLKDINQLQHIQNQVQQIVIQKRNEENRILD